MKCITFSIICLISFVISAQAADQEKFDVNSPVQRLLASQLRPPVVPPAVPANISTGDLENEDLYSTGKIDKTLLAQIISNLTPAEFVKADKDKGIDRVTIIHLLRWSDTEHKTTKFETWYVFDPHAQYQWSYLFSSIRLQGGYIAGKTHFRFIYIHLNSMLGDANESIKTSAAGGPTTLKIAVGYKITIQKQQPQIVRDALTVLKIVGGIAANEVNPEVGYYSVFDFNSKYSTSSISITATLEDANAKPNGTDQQGKKTATNDLSSKVYSNERLQWFGLGFAIPATSYKDAQFDDSTGTIQPKTINRQNVYLTANVFVPPSETGNLSLRWLPHPFFGIPIKGQPLRNTMVGIGAGYRWLQPFWGVIFDIQRVPKSGSTPLHDRLVRKGTFGLNLSVDAVAKALLPKKGN